MKKIVKGHDFVMKVPVRKIVGGEAKAVADVAAGNANKAACDAAQATTAAATATARANAAAARCEGMSMDFDSATGEIVISQ